jgi:molybdopterin molybdotransferase
MAEGAGVTLVEADWWAARDAAGSVAAVLDSESVSIDEAAGRVLAVDCAAKCDLPSFDTSAMDGWVVSGPGPWRIVGDVAAGAPLRDPLARGTGARIATGAVIPVGADAVLRWEDADVTAGEIRGTVEPGADIRSAGEECRAGDLIARAGADVGPALAGFLAATGYDDVPVVRRPRVQLLLLGDELLQSGVPSDGRVRDSLGPQLPRWLAGMGAEVVSREHVTDQLDAVVEAFRDAAASVDLVITTGGTAAGPRDHVHAAIRAAGGELIVDRVAVRPGHPMLLACLPDGGRSRVPIVGLPGNPHSAVVGLMTLGRPIVDSMLGRPRGPLRQVPTGEELRAPAGHTRLIAGVVIDGLFHLSPYGGSAMLRGLAQSTGFAVAREGVTPSGALVDWLPLPG